MLDKLYCITKREGITSHTLVVAYKNISEALDKTLDTQMDVRKSVPDEIKVEEDYEFEEYYGAGWYY